MVATDRGGPPQFVRDGHDGVLVDPFDTTAFAHTLEGLLLDPERRAGASATPGAARVREFGWPAIAERYRQVYSSRRSRPGAVVKPSGRGRVPEAGSVR